MMVPRLKTPVLNTRGWRWSTRFSKFTSATGVQRLRLAFNVHKIWCHQPLWFTSVSHWCYMISRMPSAFSVPWGHLPPPASVLLLILCPLLDCPFHLTGIFYHPFRMTFSVDLEVNMITIYTGRWAVHPSPAGTYPPSFVRRGTLLALRVTIIYSHVSRTSLTRATAATFISSVLFRPFVLSNPLSSKTCALLPHLAWSSRTLEKVTLN